MRNSIAVETMHLPRDFVPPVSVNMKLYRLALTDPCLLLTFGAPRVMRGFHCRARKIYLKDV